VPFLYSTMQNLVFGWHYFSQTLTGRFRENTGPVANFLGKLKKTIGLLTRGERKQHLRAASFIYSCVLKGRRSSIAVTLVLILWAFQPSQQLHRDDLVNSPVNSPSDCRSLTTTTTTTTTTITGGRNTAQCGYPLVRHPYTCVQWMTAVGNFEQQ